LVYSIIINGIIIFVQYLFALALNTPIPLLDFIIFVPIVIFLTSVPISISGIGIREGSYIYIFSNLLGYSSEIILSISLLSYLLIFSQILTGFIVINTQRLHENTPPTI
ncbi:lysylphosphatidylglycerol synthase domain-containing protein, partial [bacterium]|nr:lysylphosphatidylglycerol synthase domain-containing protein [bacterium]